MRHPSTARARWPTRAIPIALTAWLHPGPARAHGSLAVGDFYSGMLHPLLHFETLLPALALALWAGQLGTPHAWRLPLAFLGAAMLGALAGVLEIALPLGNASLRVSMLVLGLLVAARGALPAWMALAMAALFGLLEGQVHTYEPEATIERPALFISGVGASIGLILFHVVTRVVRYRAFWVQIGVRVLGSWIAATGLLVLALQWRAVA